MNKDFRESDQSNRDNARGDIPRGEPERRVTRTVGQEVGGAGAGQ